MVEQKGSELPKFSNPPIFETVLSVEFERLPRWSVPYFGLYWNTIRGRYPKFEIKPAIDSNIEDMTRVPIATPPGLQLTNRPDVRCWFISDNDLELIQSQEDRLIFNWRKSLSNQPYPHYDAHIRPRFETELKHFDAFLNDNEIGKLKVRQCEVSYINHIETGSLWSSIKDIPRVFTAISTSFGADKELELEHFGFDMAYRLPDSSGRLRISLRPALRRSDGEPLLQFTLTARGKPESSSFDDVLSWMDDAHAAVVKTFCEETTKFAHSSWGRVK